jgi:outer membrane immunogenic protein
MFNLCKKGSTSTMSTHALKLSSVALFVLGSLGAAGAADMPVKAPPVAAPPPIFSWTGCYIGGFVGGAGQDGVRHQDSGNATFRSFSGGFVAGRLEDAHVFDNDLDTTFIGGGTVGCNWQSPGSPFVFGVEGEVGFMKLKGDAFDPFLAPNLTIASVGGTPDVLASAKIGDWYAMATGRLGYAWDRTLLYVKGGAAFVPIRASIVDSCATVAIGCGNWLVSSADKDTVTTWTVGGGIEWAFADNWSIKGEYMFIGLDDSLTSCGTATLATGVVVGGGPFCHNHAFDGIHTAKVGINYRFGGGFLR